MNIHKGSCHCQSVTFEVVSKLDKAMRCNCSICKRTGAVFQPCSDEQLTIKSGKSDLNEYQFGTRTATHYFCKKCGITPFIRPRIAPHLWVVNLRCIDSIVADEFVTGEFDGVNWEESAKAFINRG
jgi:hypothetical protein